MDPGAELVCRVETPCGKLVIPLYPINAASFSRDSPTMMMSGSARKAVRMKRAKAMRTFLLI